MLRDFSIKLIISKMKYTLYYILIIMQYISQIKCSVIDKNNTDVFITYAGHSDLDRPISKQISKPLSKLETVTEIPISEDKKETEKANTEFYEDVTEGIVFIPNDKPVFRNEDVYSDGLKLGRRIGGLMQGENIRAETESPKNDILFVSGKNNENIEKPAQIVKQERQERQDSTHVRKTKGNKNKLNCNDLNCNNSINSLCGGKEEDKKIKYRLFLNECFFRKVNCGFRHAANRYDIVPMENCKNVGAHYPSRPYMFKPVSRPAQKVEVNADARRSFSSRRSLNKNVDGSLCEHGCPASCTEDYDPQCAVSSRGQIKMFLNHCKLDYNSCLYKVVWHRRPLSQCVGGRKADMMQNRGFIAWMQRVGIVDGKGKLVLS